MAARAREDDEVITGINVTPLVDVALVLLIIFMVTARVLAPTPAITANVPSSGTSTGVESPFAIELRADGAVLVGGERVASDAALSALARAAEARDPEVRAVLHADAAVPHGRVIRAMDLLKQAGVTRIAFAVVPRADAAPLVAP